MHGGCILRAECAQMARCSSDRPPPPPSRAVDLEQRLLSASRTRVTNSILVFQGLPSHRSSSRNKRCEECMADRRIASERKHCLTSAACFDGGCPRSLSILTLGAGSGLVRQGKSFEWKLYTNVTHLGNAQTDGDGLASEGRNFPFASLQ